MKFTLTLAALLALGSAVALAEETKKQAPAPIQMTAAEMDKVVAGADQLRLMIKQKLQDGSCLTK